MSLCKVLNEVTNADLWEVVDNNIKNDLNELLRIYEVRLNEISNYKQMLVGVSCVYAGMSSKFYENVDRNIK